MAQRPQPFITTIPLQRRSAAYACEWTEFVKACELAMPALDPGKHPWGIDGYTSHRMFLTKPSAVPEVWPLPAEAEFEIERGAGQITLSVLTRSQVLIKLFESLTEQLDLRLRRVK